MGNCLRGIGFGVDTINEDYSLLTSHVDDHLRRSSDMGNVQDTENRPELAQTSSRERRTSRERNAEREILRGNPEFLSPPRENAANLQASPDSGQESVSQADQVKLAQRFGLIQHLPSGLYDGGKKDRECPICMVELNAGDPVRFLPCMHVYHKDCIDDWLLKHSLACPNCMEPVDSAVLNSYEVGRTPWNFST